MLRRLSLVVALALAAACGSGAGPAGPGQVPAAASPLVPSGIWAGTLDVTTCLDPRSGCPAHITAWPHDFSIRIAEQGGALSAVVESPLLAMPVVLTGTLAPDGSARFAGSYQNTRASGDLRSIEVSDLLLRPDPMSGLSGTFAFAHHYTSSSATLRGVVLSASHRPFAETSSRPFQGTWSGFGVMTACSGDCAFYEPGRSVSVTLRATQIGAGVSGEFAVFIVGLPVSGTTSGPTLNLTGEARYPIIGGIGTSLVRLDRFSAEVDALGRLTGTLRYYREGVRSGTKAEGFGLVAIAETTDVQLLTVMREY